MHYKYELEIREPDILEFVKSHSIINGENYRGHLFIKNHIQSEKTSNVVSVSIILHTHVLNCGKYLMKLS